MKKLLASLLVFAMMMALAACGGGAAPAPAATEAPAAAEAPAAVPEEAATPAEPEEPAEEPAPAAPYGIPVWNSVDDVDLKAVFDGHSMGNLLSQMDNVLLTQQVHLEGQYGDDVYEGDQTVETFYTLEGERYAVSTRAFDSTGAMIDTASLTVIEGDTVFSHTKSDWRDEDVPFTVEQAQNFLQNSMLFDLDRFNVEELAREAVDGKYVITFRMTPVEELQPGVKQTFNDFVLELDPATSLIQSFSYQQVSVQEEDIPVEGDPNGAFMPAGGQTVDFACQVQYNADRQQDYSMMES